jgi:hypothetical protein
VSCALREAWSLYYTKDSRFSPAEALEEFPLRGDFHYLSWSRLGLRMKTRTIATATWILARSLAWSDPAPQVQVMPPWHVFHASEASAAYARNNPDAVVPMSRLSSILPYLIDPIVRGLDSRGFAAFPALYTSGVQLTRDFESKEMVNYFLGMEFPEQRKYLTVVPVVFAAEVVRRSMMISSELEIRFRLELYAQDSSGRLGKFLFGRNFSFGFHSAVAPSWADVEKIFPALRQEISRLPQWDSAAATLRALSPGFVTRFAGKFDSTLAASDRRLYFAQSEVFRHAGQDTRLTKADFQCQGKSSRGLDDLTFSFQANDKWPLLLYAYIINPGGNVIRVDAAEAHVEQSPRALPTKIYDWSRVLVVNLPGLKQGSVVTYAISFLRFAEETAAPQVKRHARDPFPLGKDAHIFAAPGEPFQIRVWADPSDTVAMAARDALLDTAGKIKIGAENLFFARGRGKAEPSARGWSSDPFEPTVRLSTARNWGELLGSVRDSVFSRLPPPPSGTVSVPVRLQEEALFRVHRFIQDSLRYVSLSFGERAYVPAFPDSVLRSRMGDCKDFSVFMISKLRAAGVQAYPALLDAYFRHNLFGPPSFDATNHMIVYLPALDRWIDPTGPAYPARVLPWHLSDAQALVLYPDSVSLRALPKNGDSTYARRVSYACRDSAEDLHCRLRTIYSSLESLQWRRYLKEKPADKWPEILNPSDWIGAFRQSETGTKVVNMDAEAEDLIVERSFTCHKAVMKVGSKTIVRFPETPFSQVFDRTTANGGDEETAKENGPVMGTVDFTLESDKPIRWPIFKGAESSGFYFRPERPSSRTFRIIIRVPAGEVSPSEKPGLEKVLGDYKDFFSSSMIAG